MMFIVSRSGPVLPVDEHTVLVEVPGDGVPPDYADNPACTVIPLLENLQYEETPVVTLDRELIEVINERLEQIDDPDDTLMETEFMVEGVRVRIQ